MFSAFQYFKAKKRAFFIFFSFNKNQLGTYKNQKDKISSENDKCQCS